MSTGIVVGPGNNVGASRIPAHGRHTTYRARNRERRRERGAGTKLHQAADRPSVYRTFAEAMALERKLVGAREEEIMPPGSIRNAPVPRGVGRVLRSTYDRHVI